MGGEFASGEPSDVDRLDDGSVERALSRAWEMDPVALPSFKQLPRHRRAEHRQAGIAGDPPPSREPTRMPQPMRVEAPLLLTEAMRIPQALPRRRWRLLRVAALLLVGSAIGAVAMLAAMTPTSERSTDAPASTYLTVLPPAAPAAPPPPIIYVDRWQIVSPEPRLLQDYQVFAPAMPIAPPPEIVFIERAAGTPSAPSVKPKVSEASSTRPQMKPQAPEARPLQQDVAKEIERWLSRSPDRR